MYNKRKFQKKYDKKHTVILYEKSDTEKILRIIIIIIKGE